MPRLLLASASPRRAELLTAAGFEFDVLPANVDETVHRGEAAEAYVRRVAEAKAAAVASKAGVRMVLAADTAVVVDGEILGKPTGNEDAARMLRLLSGRGHEVMTAVTLVGPADHLRQGYGGPPKLYAKAEAGPHGNKDLGSPVTAVETTTVEFAPLTDEDIQWYLASGEPRDKAGAYAIQGLASRFVTRIDGSYSNVVGLPVALVSATLKALS